MASNKDLGRFTAGMLAEGLASGITPKAGRFVRGLAPETTQAVQDGDYLAVPASLASDGLGLAEQALGPLSRGLDRVQSGPIGGLLSRANAGYASGRAGTPLAGQQFYANQQGIEANADQMQRQQAYLEALSSHPDTMNGFDMNNPASMDAFMQITGQYFPERATEIAQHMLKSRELHFTNEDGIARGFDKISGAQRSGPAAGGDDGRPTKSQLDQEKFLRADFTKAYTTPAREALRRLRQIQGASDNPAGHLAMIFNFMKILDPGSAVREGEQATAANTAGVSEQVRNLYNRVLSGDRLSPEQVQRFREESSKQVKSGYLDDYASGEAVYRGLAERAGARPDQVTVPAFDSDDIFELFGGKAKLKQAVEAFEAQKGTDATEDEEAQIYQQVMGGLL